MHVTLRRRVPPERRRAADRCCSICRAPVSRVRRPTRRAPRRSPTTSSRFSCRTSGSLAPNLTINYGLRWDAQRMPDTVDPSTTAFAAFLSDPAFPSDGTIPNQWNMWQPRVGVAWDVQRRRPVGRPGELRHLLRAAEHAEPGRDRHDQRRAAADDRSRYVRDRLRDDAGLARRGESDAAACRVSFPLAAASASSTRTT